MSHISDLGKTPKGYIRFKQSYLNTNSYKLKLYAWQTILGEINTIRGKDKWNFRPMKSSNGTLFSEIPDKIKPFSSSQGDFLRRRTSFCHSRAIARESS